MVSSLAMGPRGVLFAGTMPEGRVYRVSSRGEVTELVRLEGAEHVWALVWDRQRGKLFAATGPEGKVFAITPRTGNAEVYWDAGSSHVMTLALDGDGSLYAGTSNDAIVVRLRGPGRAEVVYDFPGNEVTALAVRDGALAVVANEFPQPAAVSRSKSSKARPRRARKGKGRLWRASRDGRAEKVFSIDSGHFTSVQLTEDGTAYVGGGEEGRIYRVGADRTSATWIDVDERQVLALDLTGNAPLFATADAAAIYRVARRNASQGLWTSKVLDAGFTARFGQLDWRASGALEFQTRSGNREDPDDTWSEWSAPMGTAGPVRSPGARFLQIRARFAAGTNARLLAVTAYYLPTNQRAVVRSVGIKAGRTGSSATKSKTKTKNSSARSPGPPAPSSRYKLGWQVDNPDSDRMRYRLRFRAEGQRRWRDILPDQEILTATEYTWETNGLPDGHYVVQVEASDELANPETGVLRATEDSEPLLIDNHAPAHREPACGGNPDHGPRDRQPRAHRQTGIRGGRRPMAAVLSGGRPLRHGHRILPPRPVAPRTGRAHRLGPGHRWGRQSRRRRDHAAHRSLKAAIQGRAVRLVGSPKRVVMCAVSNYRAATGVPPTGGERYASLEG